MSMRIPMGIFMAAALLLDAVQYTVAGVEVCLVGSEMNG